MKTDYNKQANDFLLKTNCTMKVEFLRHGRYFDGDKEARDIYEITIQREKRKWSFEFGQSINNSGFYAEYGRTKYPIDRDMISKTDFDLRLYVKMNIQNDFGAAKADRIIKPIPPNAYDVLACITKYDVGTFEDFCGDFGYDTDSRTAEKTYKAVYNEWLNVCRIWTDEEIKDLQEIN